MFLCPCTLEVFTADSAGLTVFFAWLQVLSRLLCALVRQQLLPPSEGLVKEVLEAALPPASRLAWMASAAAMLPGLGRDALTPAAQACVLEALGASIAGIAEAAAAGGRACRDVQAVANELRPMSALPALLGCCSATDKVRSLRLHLVEAGQGAHAV